MKKTTHSEREGEGQSDGVCFHLFSRLFTLKTRVTAVNVSGLYDEQSDRQRFYRKTTRLTQEREREKEKEAILKKRKTPLWCFQGHTGAESCRKTMHSQALLLLNKPVKKVNTNAVTSCMKCNNTTIAHL